MYTQDTRPAQRMHLSTGRIKIHVSRSIHIHDDCGYAVFENQYGQHPNATWGVPTFLELSKLQAMRDEFMPDGDLKIQVKIKKCVKARDAAVLRKCSVADVLQKVHLPSISHTPVASGCTAASDT